MRDTARRKLGKRSYLLIRVKGFIILHRFQWFLIRDFRAFYRQKRDGIDWMPSRSARGAWYFVADSLASEFRKHFLCVVGGYFDGVQNDLFLQRFALNKQPVRAFNGVLSACRIHIADG